MSAGASEEDTAMEKKSNANRQSSVPPKGSGAETKKTDNGNSSKQNRYNRRREGNQHRPRNEAVVRRPAPQKPKAYDKRTRNRGYQGDWQRQEVSRDGGAELGSAQRPGSKKENLNHLLNFTFTRREGEAHAGWGGRGGQWKGHNRWTGHKAPAFNKEQFLQANCQFVVKAEGDYSHHVADADLLVEWDLVEQVRIFSNDVPSCPICLYPPVAARITRCGHIYCWSCVLHYLSLGEKSWRKCPICYESIHQKDLKSVMALETHSYSVGEEITMKLIKRDRGSTYAMPSAQWSERSGKPHNMEDTVDTCYAKLLVATPEQVQAIVESEQTALECQLMDEGEETLEGSYTKSAIDMLKVRRDSLGVTQSIKEDIAEMLEKLEVAAEEDDIINTSPDLSHSTIEKGLTYSDAFDDVVEDVIDQEIANDDVIGSEHAAEEEAPGTPPAAPKSDDDQTNPEADMPGEDAAAEDTLDVEDAAELLMLPAQEDASPTTPSAPMFGNMKKGQQQTSTYYYYQAADGQHIYMHSVNARCLIKEYGSWEACPETITANIVEVEGITMNAELRRRLRYLGHLPLSCEFRVAELALQPPVVSKETLHSFNDEIEKRRRARQRKSRDERRFTKKMKAVEDKKNGKEAGLRVSLGSSVHFPEYGFEAAAASASQPVPGPPSLNSSTTSTPLSTPHGSPPQSFLNPNALEFTPRSPSSVASSVASDEGAQTSGGAMSFAQMLRAGKTQPAPAWPRTAATKPSAPVRSQGGPRHGSDSEGESEDRVPVPDYKASIGDAFQQALEQYKSAPVEEPQPQQGGKKKKKKKKEMLLFATTMARTK